MKTLNMYNLLLCPFFLIKKVVLFVNVLRKVDVVDCVPQFLMAY